MSDFDPGNDAFVPGDPVWSEVSRPAEIATLAAMIGDERIAMARLTITAEDAPPEPGELAPEEARRYESITHPKRRREWLAGRRAAKDAVTRLLAPRVTETRALVIAMDDDGVPFVRLPEIGPRCHLSIAHADDVALAIATVRPGVGIDVAHVDAIAADLLDTFATLAELQRVAAATGSEARARAVLWSSKEAGRKAIGAHRHDMTEVALTDVEPADPFWRVRLRTPDGEAILAAARLDDAGRVVAVAWRLSDGGRRCE